MEYSILEWINNHLHGNDFINHLFKWVSLLGDVGFIWIISGAILLAIKKHRPFGIILLLSLLTGWIINDCILKVLISRPRPFVTYPEFQQFIESINMSRPRGNSFPSGHAYSSFNAATILFFAHKKNFGIAAISLAIVIALSRIFLCVHYPSDVLVGAICGTITGLGAVYFYRYLKKKRAINHAS